MASLFRGGQDPTPDQAFTHVRTAPVHTLSHVLANYLALLGQNAKARAEVGGRATVTLADAMGAIGEMGTSTKQMVEYVEQLKRSSGVGPERERHQAFAQSGELLKNVSQEPRKGTPLTYKAFTSDELAALETASDTEEPSEPETAQTSPAPSEGDSSGSSDDDDTRMRPVRPPRPRERKMTKRKAAELAAEADRAAIEAEAVARWKNAESVPDHVPAFLPPIPGLERVVEEQTEGGDIKVEDAPAATVQPVVRAKTVLKAGASWRASIPFEASELAKEADGSRLPSLTLRATSPPPIEESGSLDAFYKLHGDYRMGKDKEVAKLVATNKRRRLATITGGHHLEQHDSLYGSIPVEPYRELTRTSGWVPYAYDVQGRHSVYLRDFDGPNMDSVTSPASFLADTHAPPAGRAPPPLSYITRHLARQNPVLASRLTRIAPPGPLDVNGMTTPYALDDAGAVAAVRQPPHHDPLFFMPGWQWPIRNPMEATLPGQEVPVAVPKLEELTDAMDVDAQPAITAAAPSETIDVDAAPQQVDGMSPPPSIVPPPRPSFSPVVSPSTGGSGLKLSFKFGGGSGGGRSPLVTSAAGMATGLMAASPSSAVTMRASPMVFREGSPTNNRAASPPNGATGLRSPENGSRMGTPPTAVQARSMSPVVARGGSMSRAGSPPMRAGSPLRESSLPPEPVLSPSLPSTRAPSLAPSTTPPSQPTPAPMPTMPAPTEKLKLKLSFGPRKPSLPPPTSTS